ncbi:MAG: phosphoribosylaminoimidazolecarboxamide formyltransferase [Prevotella sp.]
MLYNSFFEIIHKQFQFPFHNNTFCNLRQNYKIYPIQTPLCLIFFVILRTVQINISKMKELSLKYGCNPNQKPSRIYMEEGELPIEVINGRPGYINFLDALNSWQLVKELKAATGMPAAASFKHVSPAGAAIGLPLTETLKRIYFVDDVDFELTPLACAYARARGADRMCSYGDFVALSDVCDAATARLIKREVSDGVIAPGYTPEAIEILHDKRKGTYNVIQIDPDYTPAPIERKQVFGITFEQGRNEIRLDDPALFENIPTQNKTFSPEAKRDLVIALITLKYTQSNSVCYVKDGQAIGIGAGQQSRIHCTRLAGNKADIWWLRQSPQVMNLPFKPGIRRADRDNTIDVYISDEYEDVLRDGTWQQFFTEKPEVFTAEAKKAWIAQNTGVALGSDAFFPFGDNIERAHKSGVQYIAQAGGSIRDDHVIDTCDKYGIAMAFTGVRLFHH